jgi:hypothetical protein
MVEFAVRVAGLRETHRRRPSLIAMLDKAGRLINGMTCRRRSGLSTSAAASGVGPWLVLVPNWPYSGRTREVGHGDDSDT